MDRVFAASRGFTLVEVVVAMAIIGVGVVTVLQVFSAGLRLAGRTSAVTESAARGREIMDEALARHSLPGRTEERSGGGRERWTVRTRPLELESERDFSQPWGIEEITVEVRTRIGAEERDFTLRTFRLTKEEPPR